MPNHNKLYQISSITTRKSKNLIKACLVYSMNNKCAKNND